MFKQKNNLILVYNKKFFIRRQLLTFKDFVRTQELCGLKIKLAGRLKGVKRARKLQKSVGHLHTQTLILPNYTKQTSIQTQ